MYQFQQQHDIDPNNQFGENIVNQFQLDPNLIHFNNGSFGTVPHSVRKSRIEWLDKIESHPDLIMSEQLNSNLQIPLKKVAKFVNADVDDLIFIKNATQGINIVLRSLDLNNKDTLLYFNTTYNSIQSLAEFLNKKQGVNLIKVQHTTGSDNELINSVIQSIQKAESQNKKITVAVVDAISSVPGLILPYEKMTQLLQSHGAKVIIDGAHAIGQIPLNLKESKADYFVTNLHKWGYAYRPTAILYVKKDRQDQLHSTVIGVNYDDKEFKKRFEWPGTIDFSTWLSAGDAIDFINKYGEHNIRNYIHTIVWKGGNFIADKLNTKVMGKEYQNGNMINIMLPWNYDDKVDYGAALASFVWEKYNTRIKCYYFENRWWVRLSGQLFLTFKDFEKLAKVLPIALDQFSKQFVKSRL